MRLILGSQSPRRAEILGYFSVPFEQHSHQFAEELVPYEEDPLQYALTLSQGKALSLSHLFPEAVILCADTIVFKNGKIFNKPASEEEGFEMLKELNGSWHSVYTALTAQHREQQVSDYELTRLEFHQLDENKLKLYHKTFDGIDKSGGYGVQMAGSVILKQMEGCFYNVMGLPVSALCRVLGKVGIDLWDYLISC